MTDGSRPDPTRTPTTRRSARRSSASWAGVRSRRPVPATRVSSRCARPPTRGRSRSTRRPRPGPSVGDDGQAGFRTDRLKSAGERAERETTSLSRRNRARPTLTTSLVAVASGLAGGGMGAYLVSRATRAALAQAVERSERVAEDGGRAARETLMRSRRSNCCAPPPACRRRSRRSASASPATTASAASPSSTGCAPSARPRVPHPAGAPGALGDAGRARPRLRPRLARARPGRVRR